MTITTAFRLFVNNRNLFCATLVQKFSYLFTDKKYLELLFKYRVGYKLDLSNPTSFNEKLNWLKLYDHNPLYSKLVDKYEVKKYVASIIGEDYIIPTLLVWDTPESIDFNELPEKFVLKTTHGGGNAGVILCKNKNDFDEAKAKALLTRALKQDIYKEYKEWPYKNIEKRIICEPYMEDSATKELRDYKFFCFDGKVRALFVATDRQKREEPYFNFFDENYNPLPIKQGHPVSDILPAKPSCFETMKVVASKLSEGLPQVRIDLYEVNGHVYFGEFTFYHFGGLVPFEPQSWDYEFGKWIDLSQMTK